MGLTSALFTGLSGLNSSQFRLDVIGDNIANINTTGFKGSRTLFQTQFARTLSSGTKPGTVQGGTNPAQIGLGSTVGSIQRSFTAGSIESTGVPSDLAIEGDGFFILRTPENEKVFTRDGAFTLSADNRLITTDGFFVQGFGVNQDFELIPGAVSDLTIPLGALTAAKATTAAQLDGTLNSSGVLATQGNILQSQILHDAANVPITGATLLTDVRNPAGPPLLAAGDVITINGIKRGGRDVPAESFIVGTTGTTVTDFLNWMDEVTGIETTAGVAGSPGSAVTATGQLELRSNAGTQNAISIASGTLTSNGTTQIPFTFTETQTANGESATTSFVIYDSLGTPLPVNLTMVLEARTTGSSTWRYYATAAGDSDVDFAVGTGTVTFDANGQFLDSPANSISINRAGSGANDPVPITLNFSRLSGLNTATSSLVMSFQDGFSTGTLLDYNIGQDGIITGTFTNGLNQTIGQIALATFSNPAGLIARSNNTYFIGPNSGEARITAPLTLGAGRISAGSLELSNVDLSREFINLITSSTAFSAAGRVISTSDQLLQELLLIGRR
ncbi:MAG TPA: flagellar hook-basal body complex protein [Phycisphaerae bacterium]|nr:flagellar hook-basal body complex protein [Phycisphaerae bacterium]